MKTKLNRKVKQEYDIKRFQLDNEFKSIFSHKELHNILQEDTNSFPLWFYCMNYFIDKVAEKKNIQNEGLLNFRYFLKKIGFYIKQSLSKKDKAKLDVLFISRDRFVKIRTINGIIKSDYLFYSIIHYLNRKYPNIRMGLLSNLKGSPPANLNIKVFTIHQYVTLSAF